MLKKNSQKLIYCFISMYEYAKDLEERVIKFMQIKFR